MERGIRMEKEAIIRRYFQSWIDKFEFSLSPDDVHLSFRIVLHTNSAPPEGGAPSVLPPLYRQVVISSSTIFAQRSMLSAAMCSYLPWKAKPPVHRFGVGRPM